MREKFEFYKESKFRNTDIGPLPEEWEVVRLGEVTIPTENIDPTKQKNAKFKYLDISNIDNIFFKVKGWNIITGENAPSRARKRIKHKDVVFATTRPYLKNIAIVPPELDGEICFTGFCVLRANTEKTIPEWIFYNVITDRFITRISARMVGATYPAVSDKDVFDMKIPLPPLPEQRRIARVLSTVDEALSLTDEAIARTERVKRGLMQRLLTRGLGHEKFKKTEIGEIPEEWEVVRLGEISKIESGGTPNRKEASYWIGGTIPWIKSGELNDSIILSSEEFITKSGLENSSAKIFPKNTLLIALYGATVGKTGLLGISAATNQAIAALLPKQENRFDPRFLQYMIIYLRGKLISTSSGGAQSNIYLYVLKSFKLPLPPLPEQRRIAEILGAVDEKLELLRARREKLERVKKGLMQDLLTGRKRVPEGVV